MVHIGFGLADDIIILGESVHSTKLTQKLY